MRWGERTGQTERSAGVSDMHPAAAVSLPVSAGMYGSRSWAVPSTELVGASQLNSAVFGSDTPGAIPLVVFQLF